MLKVSRRKFLKYLVGAGILGAAAYPVFIERYIVLIKSYRVRVPDLPRPFNGFRIVHLTDFHYGFLMPLILIKHVVNRVNAIKKDIVVCTGDYVHEKNSVSQINQVWPVLAQLKAPSGVYSVLGNHDHWANTKRSLYWLDRSGQNIRGRAKPIEKGGHRIWIAGGGDLWEDPMNIDDVLKQIPADEFRIMLAHNPDSADLFFKSRMDMMLAGHTHGGQVNIPFWGTPVLPVQNKNYSRGITTSTRGDPIFISRGIGWSLFPVRFNCFPEISVLELTA